MSAFQIRPARALDAPRLADLMRELAVYEKLDDGFTNDAGALESALFTADPCAAALVAEEENAIVGYVVWFRTYSTFTGKHGIWLEDLYVTPSRRGSGIGRALMKALAREAARLGCGRVEWSVLDWNTPAIEFYRRLGAQTLPDWRICRLDGSELDAFAAADECSATV